MSLMLIQGLQGGIMPVQTGNHLELMEALLIRQSPEQMLHNLNTTSFDYAFATSCNTVANAGVDVAICKGASTTLNGSGGGTYSWSPAYGLSATNIANPVATPGVTTTYTLTVTNGGCTNTDKVTVTVNPLPPAALGYAYQKAITINGSQVSGSVRPN